MLDWFKVHKDMLDGIQTIVTIVGILVGAIWTYILFVKKRQKYPRAELAHRITAFRLSDRRIMLSVTLGIKNPGEVLLTVTTGFTRIQQRRPLHESLQTRLNEGTDILRQGKTAIAWPQLGKAEYDFSKITKEIEPGESEELNCDFILPAEIDEVRVYSYIANKTREGIGWSTSVVYRIPPGERKGSMFQIRDRVRLISDFGGAPAGSSGVITKVVDDRYVVAVDTGPRGTALNLILTGVPGGVLEPQGPPEEDTPNA